MFDHCVARIALSWNHNVSPAYRIAFARERGRERERGENANEEENASRFCTEKRNPFCFKTCHFSKSRIRYHWEFGAADNRSVSVHELNVTIAKSFFDPNKFREYFDRKHSEKTTNCWWWKASLLKRMTLHISSTSKLILYCTVLGPL